VSTSSKSVLARFAPSARMEEVPAGLTSAVRAMVTRGAYGVHDGVGFLGPGRRPATRPGPRRPS
jgi:hypothetical protein